MRRGIYQRGNVFWIRYAGVDDRTVFESSESIKYRAAETPLIQRMQAIKEGKQPEVKKIANYTFNDPEIFPPSTISQSEGCRHTGQRH